MSNNNEDKNILLFPIIFDPYDGYKNKKMVDKSLQTPKQEDKITSKLVGLYPSMVCHQIHVITEDLENEKQKSTDSNPQESTVSDTYTHPLGRFF